MRTARGKAAAHAAPRRKLSFPIVLDAIASYSKRVQSPGGLDRKVVLEWLCRELQAKPEALLLRGFDRAYRLVIEGV
jgi:hypothetical protein